VPVLVFRGGESYNRNCETLFGERGISIYGYYKPKFRTLVLNLGTGQGTLLHELTHALADFDFPQMPDWLNEGLASLHEQSRFRADDEGPWLEGLVNWRLKGLKDVTEAGQLRSLALLLASPTFRGPDPTRARGRQDDKGWFARGLDGQLSDRPIRWVSHLATQLCLGEIGAGTGRSSQRRADDQT